MTGLSKGRQVILVFHGIGQPHDAVPAAEVHFPTSISLQSGTLRRCNSMMVFLTWSSRQG